MSTLDIIGTSERSQRKINAGIERIFQLFSSGLFIINIYDAATRCEYRTDGDKDNNFSLEFVYNYSASFLSLFFAEIIIQRIAKLEIAAKKHHTEMTCSL